MTRRCEITGKVPMVGNNVSHANNKTKRRFLPNLQDASFYSVALQKNVKIKTTTHGMRTVEHNGGLDGYLLSIAPTKLPENLRKIRKQIAAKVGALPKPEPKKRYPSAKQKRAAAAA